MFSFIDSANKTKSVIYLLMILLITIWVGFALWYLMIWAQYNNLNIESENTQSNIEKEYNKASEIDFEANTNKWSEVIDFEMLWSGYIIYKGNIYQNWKIVTNDVANFSVINEVYSQDSKWIYAWWRINNSINKNKFELLNKMYAYDDNSIYYYGQKVPITYEGDVTIYDDTFIRVWDKVIFKDKVISWADSESFEIIKSEWTYSELVTTYSKDKNYVYRLGEKISWADPLSFKAITSSISTDKDNIFFKNEVFYWNKLTSIIDRDSLEVVRKSILKDKNWYYIWLFKIEDITNKKIENLRWNYIYDSPYIKSIEFSWKTNIVEWADYESFEVLDEHVAKDKEFVYSKHKKIEYIDVKSFEILDNEYQYSKDKDTIYSYLKPIKWDVDYNSFEVLWNGYAKDKNNLYKLSKIVEWIDSETFEVLDEDIRYFKDKDWVYYGWKKL